MSKKKDETAEGTEGAAPAKSGNGKLIITIVAMNALMLGGFFFLTKGSSQPTTDVTAAAEGEHAEGEEEHEPVVAAPCTPSEKDETLTHDEKGEEIEHGAQLPLDPVTVTLQDGGYLKFTIALQLSKAANVEHFAEENEGEKARDIALSSFLCRTSTDIGDAAGQLAAKNEIAARVVNGYHGDVLDVYITEWVVQPRA